MIITRTCSAVLGTGKRRQVLTVITVVVVVTFLMFLWNGRRRLSLWLDRGSEDNIHLFRDLYGHERWPEVEGNHSLPGRFPSTVHYLWCGSKQLRFQHYLGLLSAVRVLQPLQLVFHYTHLPVTDEFWYNTWFQELKQSVPNLDLRPLHTIHDCGSQAMLNTALGFLSQHGGVFLGEGIILTGVPDDIDKQSIWFSFSNSSSDATRGVIFASRGFDDAARKQMLRKITATKHGCGRKETYLGPRTSGDVPCVTVIDNLYPRDIWGSDTPFAELARWLFYGRRSARRVQSSDEESIPRVSHYVFLKPSNILESNDFQFLHFLSVLSALYVGGFERVYIHGEVKPEGEWWDELKDENVTFVQLEKPESVFQQGVSIAAHMSDVIRVSVLSKYGGVYQDRDVVWVNRVPEWLLKYPTVATPDWPRNGEWPETFNLGVLMSRRHAPWLRHFLSTLRYYRDDKWGFNACMMSYKAYEWFPESLYVDRHGQIICFEGICHPAWHDDYMRDIYDKRPVRQFDWKEGRAFHFTVPKPPPSLLSPQAIQNGRDIYAEIGRHVLERSGRSQWLRD